MEEYRIAGAEEMEEVLDFVNMVFSMTDGSVDFRSLVPKAYLPERLMRAQHHIIRKAGRIRACIGVYPGILTVGECSIKTGYIGTVCVHPYSRRKGYMIALMRKAEEKLRQEQADMIILDGSRQRYQHYGFEKAGTKYCFNITKDSIRHCIQEKEIKQASEELTFERIEAPDHPLLHTMYEWYQRRSAVFRTREEFYVCLQSWEANTYAVMQKGKCIGYLNTSYDDNNIHEMELQSNQDLLQIIHAFMEEMCVSELGVDIGMDEPHKIDALEYMSDYYTVSMSHQIKILNYEKVLQLLLTWKNKNDEIENGKYVIQVSENKEPIGSYCMEKHDNNVKVTKTSEKEDITLDALELVRTLTTSYYFHESRRAESPLRKAPKGWFPLPFFLPEADAF